MNDLPRTQRAGAKLAPAGSGWEVAEDSSGREYVRRAVIVTAVALTVALWAFGLALGAIDGSVIGAAAGIGAVALVTVGAVVSWQRPEHRLGPLLGAVGLMLMLLGVTGAYAQHALVHRPGSLPGGTFVAWLSDLLAIPTIGLIVAVLPQLFPTGHPLSPRWRVPLWCGVGYMLAGSAGNAIADQQLESVHQLSPIPTPFRQRRPSRTCSSGSRPCAGSWP